ncbi:MAG TPA: hypothetical protein PK511_03925 [Chitinophagales bacterium]|nr:hypothetical protein [Chitinophagales bacterium]HMU68575.1 hypothetical protein [Chitinophagales bacterium]HMX05182.1 hypothetical protein [Chitinophagales bacterium]HMZ88740.1 hypothetical protein [Chitinophagales bacterium]HNA57860.1 hypothetical protein [Chitinophagales bacterium]
MKYRLLIMLVLVVLLSALHTDLQAQCAMCKATAEEGLREGNTQSANLNAGIMYLLAMPYLAFGVIGFLWYRNYKRKKAQEAAGL